MKKILVFTILLLALSACTVLQRHEPTEAPQAGLPNPASVYCEQNGNTLEIVTAADGSQSGVCIFPDGNTCDEWAYFRGECGPEAQASPNPGVNATDDQFSAGDKQPGSEEQVADWWGVIKSTAPGAQFDDYFERRDLGQVLSFGISSSDQAVQAQIAALRDSGKIVHLYGTLLSNMPDYNGSQIQVDRIETEE